MATADHSIDELAESIADAACPELPIDPERIAREEGITWTYGMYGEAFDGLLAHRDGLFHIFCNAVRGSTRRSRRGRFTFSHELGHYFIDEHRLALTTGAAQPHLSQGEWKSDSLVERQADLFAASLLMPSLRLIRHVAGQPIGMRTVLSIHDAFEVSVTSAAVRYLEQCPVPCAIVLWKTDGKFCWGWPSSKAHATRLHKTISTLEGNVDDFATARAIRGEEPTTAPYFENVTTASTWFPHIPARSGNNILMTEQAIRLGDFGVLTMLCERNTR